MASGKIAIDGEDTTSLSERRLFPVRRQVQMVFQDPFASLNPRLPTWDLITEPAHIHATVAPRHRRDMAAVLLEQNDEWYSANPLQRARTISPETIAAMGDDEPVSLPVLGG